MTHITPGEIIEITNKSQIPLTDLINRTPTQGHHLPSIDNSIIEEDKKTIHRNGIQLQCNICESMYHMAQNCPERRDLCFTQDVILFQSDFNHPEQIKNVAPKSWNAAVLESGATNLVAGKEWYNCNTHSLSFNEKTKIRRHKGTNIYQFGDGNL